MTTNEQTTTLTIKEPHDLDEVAHPGCVIQNINWTTSTTGGDGWSGSVSVFRHDPDRGPDGPERDFVNVNIHTDEDADDMRCRVYGPDSMVIGIGHANYWFNVERAEAIALAILAAAAEHRAVQS